jgi:serine/threonine protein kinase/DNA-binding CsgD family transcriptional regulator
MPSFGAPHDVQGFKKQTMTISPSPPPVIRERYQLVTWLGEGSMGVVYKAHDLMLDRDVAVKFLSPKYFSGADAVARFLREARLVARLSHPNIMSIFDVGDDQGWQYLVFEYIPGNDLHALMSSRTDPWPVDEALLILKAALEALEYAHGQGVIHRDIKPENIMLTPQGQVKVTDFGLAFAHEEVRLTKDEGMLGTILYMSPEMIQGKEIGPHTDLYSLGAVFYEMLTGEPPFAGEQVVQIISKVIHTEPVSLQVRRPDIPPALESVITRLLMKEPAQRYPSAQEALSALTDEMSGGTQAPTIDIELPKTPSSSLVKSIVRASLSVMRRPEAVESPTDEENLLLAGEDPEQAHPLAQKLLLYASTEDIITVLESERRRMAGLLKSDVIEPLNLLLSQAGTYEKTLGANQMAQMVASVLSTLARQVLQQVRDLNENLQPLALETMGLEVALENLASQIRRTRGLQIQLELVRLPDRLSTRMELALFRLCQDYFDGLQTIGASQATARLKRQEEAVVFEIANDARTLLDDRTLAASRERLEQLGCNWQAETGKNRIAIRFGLAKPLDLTPRELDVIRLVAEGLSNKEIGQSLAISPRTVNFHLDNLFAKLGVRSRTEAAILALQQGWVERKP